VTIDGYTKVISLWSAPIQIIGVLIALSLLAEVEIKIVYALLGKSDEVVRVSSKPGHDQVMIVEFEGGEQVEIEVRAWPNALVVYAPADCWGATTGTVMRKLVGE
jgi:hypothetical protein